MTGTPTWTEPARSFTRTATTATTPSRPCTRAQTTPTTDGVDQDCDGVDGPGGGGEGGNGGGTGDAPGDDLADADQDGSPIGEDCNDAEPAAFPGNPESCGDGIDNDCDGFTDDLDADCIPKGGGGCSANPTSPPLTPLGGLVGLGLMLSARRRRRRQPRRSSDR